MQTTNILFLLLSLLLFQNIKLNDNLIYEYELKINGNLSSLAEGSRCSYITFGDTILPGLFNCYEDNNFFVEKIAFGYPYIPVKKNDTIYHAVLDSSPNYIPRFLLRANDTLYVPDIKTSSPFVNKPEYRTSFSYYTGLDTIISVGSRSANCWIFKAHDYIPTNLNIEYYIDKDNFLPVKLIYFYPNENVLLEFSQTSVKTFDGKWPKYEYIEYYNNITEKE